MSVPNTFTPFAENRDAIAPMPTKSRNPENRQNTLTFILSYFHTFNFSLFPNRRNPIGNPNGFTLIEIIVTIIISAVLATVLAQVITSQTERSYRPIQTIEENLALRAVMDNIASDYRQLLQTDAAPLVTLQNRIGTSGFYGDAGDPYTNGVSLEATTSCINFDTNNDEDPTAAHTNCDISDTVLKVTLAVTGTQHRLTSLFTR